MADVSETSISAIWKGGTFGLGMVAVSESNNAVHLFSRQNALAVARLLAQLDGESLLDLLATLSRDAREPFLKMFGLLERWHQLRRSGKLRTASLRALLPTLRDQLRTAPDEFGEEAVLLLLWWWGSRAAEPMRGFLHHETQDQTIAFAFAEVRARAGELDRKAMEESLRSVQLPSEVLSRIFLGLPDALALDQDAFAATVDAWIGSPFRFVTPLAASASVAAESSARSAEEVEPGEPDADTGTAVDGARAAGPPAGTSVEGERRRAGTDRPEAVLQLVHALAAYREAKGRYDEVHVEDDVERVDAAHAALKATGNRVRRQLEEVNAFLTEAQRPAAVMPRSVYSDPAEAERWLGELAEVFRAAEETSRARVEAARAELIGRLTAAGLPIPDELSVVRSFRDVERIHEACRSQLAQEEAYRRIVAGQDAPAAMFGLQPDSRLTLYERLAGDPPFAVGRAQLLGWLMRDTEVAGEVPLALVRQAIVFRLSISDGLLPGTWAWLASLRVDSGLEAILPMLAEPSHVELISALPDELLDLDGLETVAATMRERLPTELSIRLQLRATRRLPVEDRVRRTTALALDADLDARVVNAALSALVDAGRWRTVLLVLALALKEDCDVEITDELSHAILAALIDAADDPAARDVIQVILHNNPFYLTGHAQDALVFVYLCAAVRSRDAYLNLQFTDPESLDEVERTWPVLTRYWRERLEEQNPDEHPSRREMGQQAHTLLDKLEHELQRPQIHSWNETKAYKRYFDKELRAAVDALDAGQVLPPLDPGAMYKRARAAGQLREPDRSSDANNEMIAYLERQIERIVRLGDLLRSAGDMATLRRLADEASIDVKQALREEGARLATSPVLACIYRRAVEDCDGDPRSP